MSIVLPTTVNDAESIAFIVSGANRDIAQQFNINIKNAPKHPSFCTTSWILSEFERGEEYFLYKDGNIPAGCVAFEQPDDDTAYLNRLSVLPEFRHKGIGATLVRYILDYSTTKNVKIVSIRIIADHILLKNWYLGLGFIEVNTQKFDHLPFAVRYMKYEL
jgi:GNAT superfamily N-acetyltransferase